MYLKSVHIWHATSCHDHRRDFRLVNKDSPCECGVEVDIPGVISGGCLNTRVVWTPTLLHPTHPGSLTWHASRSDRTKPSKTELISTGSPLWTGLLSTDPSPRDA